MACPPRLRAALAPAAVLAAATLPAAPDAAAQKAADVRRTAPMTSPYTHEDSFINTGVRAYFIYHDFPTGGIIQGGNAKVYAVQARYAVTDTLQIVAYKDGYTEFDAGAVDDDGWNDIAAGLKWAFYQNEDIGLFAAAGAGYEFGIGDDEALQEDDEVRLWASVDYEKDRFRVGLTGNFLIPTGDEDDLGDATRFKWHARFNYAVTNWLTPTVELTGYHVLDEGDNTPLPFSGLDVANLGGGDDVVAIGFGSALHFTDELSFRAAYETELTNEDDLFGYRWTFSAVYEF